MSWLFDGEVEHRDSAGVHAMVHPGELNLMTAGAGICHSEVSTPGRVLHGARLWVALPDSARDTGRDFAHHRPETVSRPHAQLRVFLGELAGSRSPVTTFTPLLGAQLDLEPRAAIELDVDPAFEHGVLCDAGPVELCGVALAVAELGYQGPGHRTLHVRNAGTGRRECCCWAASRSANRLVMWWNFVGRNHDDIVTYRQLWQDGNDGPGWDRFGAVTGYRGAVTRLPGPPLPTTRLLPRPAAQSEERR